MTSDDVVRVPAGKFLTIGRDLCSFVWLDQSGISDRTVRRREAELAALRISQGERPGRFIVSARNGTAAWVWDDEAVDRELERAESEDLAKLPRAPEPLMLAPEMAESSARLVACMRGVEGQVWKDGILQGSRWWSQAPSEVEWNVFAAAIGASETLPAVSAPIALNRPWRPNEYRAVDQNDAATNRISFVVGAASVALLFGMGAFAGAVEWQHRGLERTIARESLKAKAVRDVEAQVRAKASRLELLAKRMQGPDGLMILNEVARLAGQVETRVTGVEVREDRIRLSLPQTESERASALLEAFENSSLFADARLASISSQANEIEVEAKIVLDGP